MTVARLTVLFSLINVVAAACSISQKPATEFLGLRVGMDKAVAKAHLNEISTFSRSEGRSQEIWKLNDNARFDTVAVGFREDKIRYVTAFVNKEEATDRVPFSSVGDLKKAKAEVMEPHHRYDWSVPASGAESACSITAYGDDPEFLTIYTVAERLDPGSGETESEEEDDD